MDILFAQLLILGVYGIGLAVTIYVIILLTRLVKATERIADRLEK